MQLEESLRLKGPDPVTNADVGIPSQLVLPGAVPAPAFFFLGGGAAGPNPVSWQVDYLGVREPVLARLHQALGLLLVTEKQVALPGPGSFPFMLPK